MQVKALRKLPKDVPVISQGEAATSWGLTDQGMPQVTCHVSLIDHYQQKHMVCNLTMSTQEARQLAANFLLMADHADSKV